jgi:hypothetical protein
MEETFNEKKNLLLNQTKIIKIIKKKVQWNENLLNESGLD